MTIPSGPPRGLSWMMLICPTSLCGLWPPPYRSHGVIPLRVLADGRPSALQRERAWKLFLLLPPRRLHSWRMALPPGRNRSSGLRPCAKRLARRLVGVNFPVPARHSRAPPWRRARLTRCKLSPTRLAGPNSRTSPSHQPFWRITRRRRLFSPRPKSQGCLAPSLNITSCSLRMKRR